AYWRHPGATAPTRLAPSFSRITLFESGAISTYNGGFIQFTRRFSDSFQLLVSYTLSKVIDTAPDGTSVVPGKAGDDAKVAVDTLAPDLERGPGVNDVRHRFAFTGVWDIKYGNRMRNPVMKAVLGDYQISLLSAIQSGRRFSAGTSGDPGNDANNF